MSKSYDFVFVVQDEIEAYIAQIKSFINDFNTIGPASVGEDLGLGLQMIKVS